MKATLELPDTLFEQLATRAASQRVRVEDLLSSYVEAGLRTESGLVAPGADPAAAPAEENDFARLQREEGELRAGLLARGGQFSGADRLPREELYDRHAFR